MIATGVSYQRESVTALWAELAPILAMHWAEIGHNPDIPLDPDNALYDRMEAAGTLRLFTVRDEDWRLIGYACYFVTTSMHHRGSLQALQDGMFILPPNRRSGVGVGLVQHADAVLRAEGVQLVYLHTPIGADHIGRMLKGIGYREVETHYFRRLDQ